MCHQWLECLITAAVDLLLRTHSSTHSPWHQCVCLSAHIWLHLIDSSAQCFWCCCWWCLALCHNGWWSLQRKAPRRLVYIADDDRVSEWVTDWLGKWVRKGASHRLHQVLDLRELNIAHEKKCHQHQQKLLGFIFVVITGNILIREAKRKKRERAVDTVSVLIQWPHMKCASGGDDTRLITVTATWQTKWKKLKLREESVT